MFAACGGTESGGVVNTTNANRSNSPNTATVVNANNSNTGVVSTTNSNVNRWANANSVTREEYNTRRAEYERGKDTSETIGQGANDSWLWFKTRAALLTTNDLRESTINVDVVNDVVTLKGTVETAAQKTKAEQVAKGIEGVKSVKNELKVSAGDSITNQMTGSGNSNTRSNANTNRR
jgi:osmotically-inducible protein OsmY